jgi:N-methylhydantoinase B
MDPITFSIIRHRLFRVIDEAVITLKHVSGTAITNEGHDLMVSIYRADGELLMGGVGFLHHLTSAAEACKAIIRRFNGQINQGDIFLLNDPYTAALHTSDVYLVAPIHHRERLIAWSACFVHVCDVGAMNPGGFSPDSTDIFTEGFSSPGLKLVDRGVLRQDVFDTLLNMVRSPEMVALDLRSLIACNNVAKERLLALVAKYGYETFDEACRLLINESESLLRRRLTELPNGEWQSRQYMTVEDEVARVLLTMTKRHDELIFDFSGSSPQSRHSINCTKWASLGGLFAPLFPLLCYDITWNEGAIRPVKIILPGNSVVNATRPAPVSVATVGAIQSVNNAACSTIGKMLSASEKYKSEATAVWHANHFAVFIFGKNQKNEDTIGTLTETFAGSGGARTFADGVDVGGEIPNPISRMANVENLEAQLPLRYLFRRRMKDSSGPGMFRGGSGMEMALVPHDAPSGGVHYVLSGKGTDFPMSEGLGGGYPGRCNNYVWVHNNDSRANVDFSQVTCLDDMPGKKQRISWGVFPLTKNDAFYISWNGGGGFGDPLDRDPQAVARDLVDSLISSVAARDIYGVVVSQDGTVDSAATDHQRRNLRLSRMSLQATV